VTSSPLEEAAALLGDVARPDVPVGPLTTYRVGGNAALFVEVDAKPTLEVLCTTVATTRVPVLIVGKGSNLLVADAGFAGIAVQLGDGYSGITTDGTLLEAGGAAAYPVVARRSVAAGLTGMEWAVGIPGSVGGAVAMNAGGHGAETKDRLVAADVVDLTASSPEPRDVPVSGLDLAYRHSAVRACDLVLRARFALDEGDADEGAARISSIVKWRRENQPGGQNAGSIFTNPPGDSAGRIIDAAGLKGFRIGTAQVSEKHANFIQADDGGSADDVRRVIEAVRDTVATRTGIELQVEVRLVG
jgi:UDP-N-acetylmuramate dehydrogenase